jgi:hypothetical protein
MKKFINKNFQKKTYENFWNPTVWNKNLQKFKDKKFWEIYIKTLGENALNVSKKIEKTCSDPVGRRLDRKAAAAPARRAR